MFVKKQLKPSCECQMSAEEIKFEMNCLNDFECRKI